MGQWIEGRRGIGQRTRDKYSEGKGHGRVQWVKVSHGQVIMVALWNRADHYIFALWLLLLSFFPRLISAAADWMSAILPHMV